MIVAMFATMFTANAQSEGKVFDMVEVNPVFTGGQDALMKHLIDNLKYPVSAQQMQIEGRVLVQFVVMSDGTVDNVHIVKSAKDKATSTLRVKDKVYSAKQQNEAIKSLDDEAMRVVKLTAGKWTPGMQKGENVNVRFTLPITYRLK